MVRSLGTGLRRLQTALSNARRAAWRRYRAVPGLLRWPVTIVLVLFLGVLIGNAFSAVTDDEITERVRVVAGGTAVSSLQVAPGRTVAVSWEPVAERGPTLIATLINPDGDATDQGERGAFEFRAGFAPARYEVRFLNTSATEDALVDVRWALR